MFLNPDIRLKISPRGRNNRAILPLAGKRLITRRLHLPEKNDNGVQI